MVPSGWVKGRLLMSPLLPPLVNQERLSAADVLRVEYRLRACEA